MSTFGMELDTLKAFLGYSVGSPGDQSRDLILNLWLEAAVDLAKSLTGRSLERAFYRDTLGYQPQMMYLREIPVVSVVSVMLGDTLLTPGTDYQVFSDTGRVQFRTHRPYCGGQNSSWGTPNYLTIDYVGGYLVLPSVYQVAILAGIQAAEIYNKQANTSGGVVKQLTVVDVGTTIYATKANATSAAMQQAMTEHLQDLLAAGPTLGAPLLSETERIGDAPESPQ